MKKVIVVGGGASGLMAAVSAARAGADVTLLEKGTKSGSKLLLTGNGRCNMTNLDFQPERDYYSSDLKALRHITKSVFRQMSVQDTLSFFHMLGLLTAVEHDSYVYPASGQASSVLSVLLREAERLRIRIKYRENVIGLERREDAQSGDWLVKTEGWAYPCDCLILACGSKALPSSGSDGSGYVLASSAGLKMTHVLPALSAIRCRGSFSKAEGVRMKAAVSAYADERKIASDTGQLQWTANGISGIVVFQVSRMVTRALDEGKKVKIRLDLLPDMGREELVSLLQKVMQVYASFSLARALEGILPPKMIAYLLDSASIRGTTKCSDIPQDRLQSLISQIKEHTLEAVSLRGFDNCQVCAGGVALSEIDPDSLSCLKASCRGLYLAGEMLDLDGLCGGYNLQWAWSSGYVAGLHAAGTEAQ